MQAIQSTLVLETNTLSAKQITYEAAPIHFIYSGIFCIIL